MAKRVLAECRHERVSGRELCDPQDALQAPGDSCLPKQTAAHRLDPRRSDADVLRPDGKDGIGTRLNAGPEGQEVISDEGFDLLAAGMPLRFVSERVLVRDNWNAPFDTQMSEAFLRKRGYRRKDDGIRPDFVQQPAGNRVGVAQKRRTGLHDSAQLRT